MAQKRKNAHGPLREKGNCVSGLFGASRDVTYDETSQYQILKFCEVVDIIITNTKLVITQIRKIHQIWSPGPLRENGNEMINKQTL